MEIQQASVIDRPGLQLREALTERELDVLELAGRGLSMKGIAQVLLISSGTVSWHLKNSYQKLDAGCRDEALRKARAQGLIEPYAVCRLCACRLGPDEIP